MFVSLPASLGLPNGKCGEIAYTATARFAAPSRLAGEQPARKARIIVAASVAANKDIERRFMGESFRFNGSIRAWGCERGKRANHNRLAWIVNITRHVQPSTPDGFHKPLPREQLISLLLMTRHLPYCSDKLSRLAPPSELIECRSPCGIRSLAGGRTIGAHIA